MLLETLDLRTNDVLIYSQNMFNFNNSFKIIYKNEKVKRPTRISYFDVCSYVKDPSPKNLIIYRLLTNVNNLDAYSTKYGYFIKINGKAELVYFDPVFAIKDLRHLRFDFDPHRFRFKIQQVGLTSLTKKEAEPSFAEVYAFDLKAIEAQNQNDKIFADAIFAFDDGYNDEEIVSSKGSEQNDEKKIDKFFRNGSAKPLANIMYGVATKQIAEVRETEKPKLSPLNAPDQTKVQELREEIITLLKQALGIEEDLRDQGIERHEVSGSNNQVRSENSEIVSNKNENKNSKIDKPSSNSRDKGDPNNVNVFDLFKTTSKSIELSHRTKESIVLKFE